jgi:uncharacterized membrane protein YfcA
VEPVVASAYSLFIVGTTSLVGAIPKYREHLVNIRTGFIFGVPSIVSIFATRKWIVPAIPQIVYSSGDIFITKRLLLLGIFALLMILASYSMIKKNVEMRNDEHDMRLFLTVFEGLIIGFLTGLVGAGGGFLIIPALVLLTGLPFKTAVGTSLFIIAINALIGFFGDLLNYQMEWRFLITITLLAVIGILIGNRLQRKISAPGLRRAFGWFILCMGIYILTRELYFTSV